MATRANVTIHLATMGDIVLDQVVSCTENTSSYAEVRIVVMLGGEEKLIVPPGGSPTRTIQGLMLIPPPDNIYPYVLRNTQADTGLYLHPFNPSYLALDGSHHSVFLLTSEAPPEVTMELKFIWV
jgi:hypothetical protein